MRVELLEQRVEELEEIVHMLRYCQNWTPPYWGVPSKG